MRRCNKFFCGIIVMVIGISVVLALCLPAAWIITILAIALIWAGFKLLIR